MFIWQLAAVLKSQDFLVIADNIINSLYVFDRSLWPMLLAFLVQKIPLLILKLTDSSKGNLNLYFNFQGWWQGAFV